jgi:hypothetical protein
MDDATKAAKQRLATILADLAAAKLTADADLAGHDPRTVAGAMNAKREAQDQVTQLVAAYKTLVVNGIVKVVVTGERAKDFARQADEDGTVVVNGAKVYEDFAAILQPTLDPKAPHFTPTQTSMLVQAIRRYMEQHQIYALNMPKLDALESDKPLPDMAALVEQTRTAIRNTNKDVLLGVDLKRRTLDAILAKRVANTVVPVFIHGLTTDEQQSIGGALFPSAPTIIVEAKPDTTDADLIQEINEKIRAVLKK